MPTVTRSLLWAEWLGSAYEPALWMPSNCRFWV